MNRISIHLPAMLCICGMVCAQVSTNKATSSKLDRYLESGMELAGVKVPYYDAEGRLKAELHGGRAKVLDGGVTDITNLRIDVFEEGKVVMTLYAPQCFSRMVEREERRILSVYSEGDVLIDMNQMTIAGRGFRFSSDSSRFEILHDSKVLVKDSIRELKGMAP